jgi:hypothetical protein
MAHWTTRLVGARAHGAELDRLGTEGDQVRSALGEGAVAWAIDVGELVAIKITQELPALGDSAAHFNALRRATTSTTLQALTLISGLVESDASLTGTEEVEIAKEFARRGLELNDLLRSIRVGYAVLAAGLLDAATQLAPDTETGTELRRISVLLFEVMDDFTSVVSTAFLDEQNTWAASLSTASNT